MRRAHVVGGIGLSVGVVTLLVLFPSRFKVLEDYVNRAKHVVEREIDREDDEEREREEREHMGPGGRPLPGADHPGEAMRFRNLSLRDELGNIPPDGLVRGKKHVQQMSAAVVAAAEPIAGISRSTWTWLGPGNIGGRVRTIAIDPTTPTTMFAGSVGGGIWKTTNGGGSWAPVDDFLADLAVSSIIFDPMSPNTMYAGTGEGFYNFDGIRGAGIFKSTDGGTTWTQLSSTNNSSFYYVNRLAISPNGATLLAATRSGIFRSTNSGASWNLQSATEATDVDFNPLDSTKAIASGYLGTASYSTDGGLSWFAARGLPGGGTFRRVEIAYAPSAPSIVYASVDVNRGSIYVSNNGGVDYSLVSNPPQQYLGGQGWYDNALWVNPFDAKAIIVGGIDLYKSTNGGATIAKISAWQQAPLSDHADHHVIVSPPDFDNSTNKVIYSGDDGGVYEAADWSTVGGGGASDCGMCTSGWTSLNNNLGVTQFYGGAGNVGTGRILGGTQDNGTLIYNGNPQAWTTEFGGDGGFAAIDPNNANILYGEYVYLALHRSLTGSGSGSDWINGLFWNGSSYVCKPAPYYIPDVCSSGGILGQANFIAPFILDPNAPNRLLGGGLSLWRTNDAATPNTATTGPAWASIKGPTSPASPISAIAVAQGNSDVVWVGHNNGDVYKTANGTATTPTWTRMDNMPPALPNRMVTRITVDPTDANVVYVTFGGFSADNIYRSVDGGFNWSNLAGTGPTGLPAVPVRDVKVFPLNSSWLYAATDLGVFTSVDGGTNWGPPTASPTDGPANVAVDELFFMGNTTLVAVTHGRGMFRTTIAAMTASVSADKIAPQPINTTITFTASSSGGTAPVSYKFLLTNDNWASWTIVQDWSTLNTWSWTPTVADANYRVGVWARNAGVTTDAPQAAASVPFAITGPAPPSSVSLTADKPSPQGINTTITFTAAPTGGVAPVSYKFLLTNNNWATWTVLQDWSTTNTYAWTPMVADSNYRVGVWARNAGVSTDAPQAAVSIPFAITGPAPPSTVSLTADTSSPQGINTTITFTATPSGGVAPISYKFLLTNNNWATWTVLQDWSTTNTYVWTSTVADANYRVGVWARSAGVSVDAPQAANSIPFGITAPAPPSSVSLMADKPSPQGINTTITFTAAPTGGLAPVSYKFLLTNNNWATWTVLQDWSTTNTYAWTPMVVDSNYRVGVWARNAGVSTDAPQAANSIPFAITAPGPPSSVSLTADKPSPQEINSSITFTATPTGGVAPVSYKFLVTNNNWTTYTVVQDWSTTNTYAWTPTVADPNYRVGVWARSAGVSVDAPQAANSIPFGITAPAPPSSVGLTADKPSPQEINTTITFTATPTGGIAPVSYKFLVTNNNWATWTVLQEWSTTNTLEWTPTVADANYRVGAWARSAGITADAPQAAFSMPFAITGP